MKILILGSEGFIGSHLVLNFLQQGADVSGCDLFERSLQGRYRYLKVSRLSPEWEEVFTGQTFDYCINAAGSGNVPYSMTHPVIDFESNTLDVIRILEAIRRFNNTCRYVHISSAAVYGNPEFLPVNEDAAKHPMSPYGWHKLMAEDICNEYHTIYNLHTAVIRPFSVYGEGLRKQLLWDICTKLSEADEIRLSGTGNESRDFIHVTDLVKLIDFLIRHSTFEFDVYNAASGIESTIRNVADVFEEYYNGKKKISFSGERRAGDPVNWRADIRKAGTMGFKPSVDLGDGIKQYAAWYNSTAK